MKAILIGDRLTGAGYRLAGVDVRIAAGDNVAAVFDDARADADLVLITAPLSEQLRDGALLEAMRVATPPIQVVPPVVEPTNAPNIRSRIRRSLGVST